VEPVQQIAEAGRKALSVLESVISLLGPFRSVHPQWKQIQAEALESLTPEQAVLASEMRRSIEVQIKAQKRLGRAEHEKQQMDLGAFIASPVGFIFRELRRLKLVEFLGAAGEPQFRVLGSAVELQEVAGKVLQSKIRIAVRARGISMRCQGDASVAIQAAEHKRVMLWVEDQRRALDRLVADYRELVAEHRLTLAALVEPPTKTLMGRWVGSSHCAAILEMLSEAAAYLERPSFSEVLLPALSRVDWKSLTHQFEAELGAWRGSHSDVKAASVSASPIDYIFERIVVDAGGHRLSAQEIFARAKLNPQTAELFAMAHINSDHRSRIRGLVGKQTKDGFLICGEEPRRGRTQTLWSERVSAPEPGDPL
jgi:hypothetical protein